MLVTGRGTAALFLAVGLLLQIAAPARPAAARQEDGGALLLQAAQTMAGLTSFHFELTTVRGKTLFMENLELVEFAGDVLRPDRFRASVTAKAAVTEITIDVVGIGTHLWISDPTAPDGGYIEVDLVQGQTGAGPSPADLLNPDRLMVAAVALIEEPVIGDTETINGVETTRVDGLFDPGRFAPAGTPPPGLNLGQPLLVSAWIDATGLVHRIEFIGPLTTVELPDVIRRLDLSSFNEPVVIEPPAE